MAEIETLLEVYSPKGNRQQCNGSLCPRDIKKLLHISERASRGWWYRHAPCSTKLTNGGASRTDIRLIATVNPERKQARPTRSWCAGQYRKLAKVLTDDSLPSFPLVSLLTLIPSLVMKTCLFSPNRSLYHRDSSCRREWWTLAKQAFLYLILAGATMKW